MYIHFRSDIVEGPTYRVWWCLHLDPQERANWDQFGAGYLTTPVVDNDARLIKVAESLAHADELANLIDPERGVSRTFNDMRAARDYENLIKRHISGLTGYWSEARGFTGELWYPKKPR